MNEWMKEAPKKTFHSPSNPKHLHPEQQGMSIEKGSFAHAYRPCIGRSGWLGQDDVDQSSWAGCQASHSVWLYVADDTERHIVGLRLSRMEPSLPLHFFYFGCTQSKWLGEMKHLTNKASFNREAVEFRVLYWRMRIGGCQQWRRPRQKRQCPWKTEMWWLWFVKSWCLCVNWKKKQDSNCGLRNAVSE